MNTNFRINFKNNKNINFYKDGSFIYFKKINGLNCSYGFTNNKYSDMGTLESNISDLFNVIPNEKYEAIRDDNGITIKMKYKKNKYIVIINPNKIINLATLSN
tara:strand:- start:515 stop:823 length:309 start_codon:yes stop_codon:yes gene_type:complete